MRVPPSSAYSATISSLRLLTSSIKAGGHDHSRPTITPIFCILPPASSSIMPTDIKLDHLQPPGPVMRPAIPSAQGIANPFSPQRAREPAVVPNVGIVSANCDDDIQFA